METLSMSEDARTAEESSVVDHSSPGCNVLKRQVSAYKLLTESLEKQLSHHSAKADEYRAAIATLESERQANAILTAERDELLAKEQQARLLAEGSAMVRDAENAELLGQIKQMREVIEMAYGHMALYLKHFEPGHNVYNACKSALALPDLSAKKPDHQSVKNELDQFAKKMFALWKLGS